MELVPGSGVFVCGQFYAGCHEQPITDGSQLVRQLVREVFTDNEILLGDDCSGTMPRRPKTKEVLDERKVNAIKGMLCCSGVKY